MIPRPPAAVDVLRTLLREAARHPGMESLARDGELALNALMSVKIASVPKDMPLSLVNFVATARQLAAAVERNAVSEGNRAQARNLCLKGNAVALFVDVITDGGRVCPAQPPARGLDAPMPARPTPDCADEATAAHAPEGKPS